MKTTYNLLIACATMESELTSVYWYRLVGEGITIDYDDYCVNIRTKIVTGNTDGLSKVYNRIISEEKESGYDWIAFVHNDVLFENLKYFVQRVVECNYPLMGVAGAVTLDKMSKKNPIAWNTMSTFHAGEVWHKNPKTGSMIISKYGSAAEKKYYKKYFPVLAIDGICIIFNKESIENEKLRFDEMFNFDFYDLDLCFTANSLGVKIGIIGAVLIHYSLGMGVLKDEYKTYGEMFDRKWNLPEKPTNYTSWSSVSNKNS